MKQKNFKTLFPKKCTVIATEKWQKFRAHILCICFILITCFILIFDCCYKIFFNIYPQKCLRTTRECHSNFDFCQENCSSSKNICKTIFIGLFLSYNLTSLKCSMVVENIISDSIAWEVQLPYHAGPHEDGIHHLFIKLFSTINSVQSLPSHWTCIWVSHAFSG